MYLCVHRLLLWMWQMRSSGWNHRSCAHENKLGILRPFCSFCFILLFTLMWQFAGCISDQCEQYGLAYPLHRNCQFFFFCICSHWYTVSYHKLLFCAKTSLLSTLPFVRFQNMFKLPFAFLKMHKAYIYFMLLVELLPTWMSHSPKSPLVAISPPMGHHPFPSNTSKPQRECSPRRYTFQPASFSFKPRKSFFVPPVTPFCQMFVQICQCLNCTTVTNQS